MKGAVWWFVWSFIVHVRSNKIDKEWSIFNEEWTYIDLEFNEANTSLSAAGTLFPPFFYRAWDSGDGRWQALSEKVSSINLDGGVDEVYTEITIASMMLHPSAANGTMRLHPNYSEPAASPKTALQKGWQQGLQIYRDQLNKLGGFSVVNATGVRSRLWTNVEFFAVALPTDSPSVQLAKMMAFMYEVINGTWGQYIPVILAPPTPYLDAAPVDQLSLICERTQACILITPITIDPNAFVCRPQQDGKLQPDCIERHRGAGRRRFDFTISTAPPSLQVSNMWLANMASVRQGMTTLAMIRCTNWQAQALEALRVARTLEIQILVDMVIPPDYNADVANWTGILSSMRQEHPDIQGLVLYIGYSSSEGRICANIMLALKAIDWYPAAIEYAASCQAVAPFVEPRWNQERLGEYGYAVAPWHPQATGADYSVKSALDSMEPFEATDEDDSPAVFWKVAIGRFGARGLASQAIVAQAATAVLVVHKACEIMSVSSPTPDDLREGFRMIDQPSHHGRISFTRYGTRTDSPYPHLQILNSTGKLLFPTGPYSPVYPAPGWSERVYRPDFFSQGGEHAVMAFTVVVLVFACLILGGLIVYRRDPVIRAATQSFCCIIVGGAMLFVSGTFVWGLHENDETCAAKPWMLFIGFMTIMTAIAVKTHRIHAIFNRDNLDVVSIPTIRLFFFLGPVWVFEVALLLAWTVSDPLRARVMVTDVYRPSKNITVCETGNGSHMFEILCVIVALICLLVNVVYAYRIRNVPTEFNESEFIGYSMYGIAIMAVIILPTLWVLDGEQRMLAYALRNLGILGTSSSVLVIIFVPKFLKIWANKKRRAYQISLRASQDVSTPQAQPPSHSAPLDKKSSPSHQPDEIVRIMKITSSQVTSPRPASSTPKEAHTPKDGAPFSLPNVLSDD